MDRRQSLTGLVAWKFMNVLPRHRRESEPINSYRPRVPPPANTRCDLEPEMRHLGQRQRPLSPLSSSHNEDVKETPNLDQQTVSYLFKLPKEVRLLIYEEVLGEMIFHIVRRKNKLGHRLCKSGGDPEDCVSDNCRGLKIQTGFHTGHGNGGLIQLLQSCRKIYSEAIDLLYSHNTFNFDSLESFVSFSIEILPQRLDSIRKLQLDFRFNLSVLYMECTPRTNWPRWERTWRIISSMVSLQELRMRFSWPQMTKFLREEFRMLEPLLSVTGLKVFEITMPYLIDASIREREDLPFRIVDREKHGLGTFTAWERGCRSPSFATSNDLLGATSTTSLIR